MQSLARTDPEIAQAVRNETRRQGAQLELIASENFVSEAVLDALGTVLTNKYAEGYPGRRYYGGCEYVDVVESLALARAKQLFACDHANVQPHSGAQANTSVYMTVMKPGDTILGMNLSHGGHLTHGHPLNFSGRFFKVVAYGVRKEDERIDYEAVMALAQEHRPKVIVVGASAHSRIIDFAAIRKAADACGAVVMADIAHIAGLVATGLHPAPCRMPTSSRRRPTRPARAPRRDDPVPGEVGEGAGQGRLPGVQGGPLMHVIAAKAVALQGGAARSSRPTRSRRSQRQGARATLAARAGGSSPGGTDNHLILVDVFARGITGKAAEAASIAPGSPSTRTRSRSTRTRRWSLRDPHRNPGLDDARHAREGDGGDGPSHRARPEERRNETELASVRSDVGRLCQRFPLYAERSPSTTACWVELLRARGSPRPRCSQGTRNAPLRRDSPKRSARRCATGGSSSPRPARAPARRSHIFFPRSSWGVASSCPPARRTSRSSSSTRTSRCSRAALGRDLSVAVMKGRGNYLCLLRYRSFADAGASAPRRVPIFRAVEHWSGRTSTGDRAEIADMPDSTEFWRGDLGIERELHRPDMSRLRRVLGHAHAAAGHRGRHRRGQPPPPCADLAVKESSYGEVIPPYDSVILDEAHLLEDVATQYFGVTSPPIGRGPLPRRGARADRARARRARVPGEVAALRHRADGLFKLLATAAGRRLARTGCRAAWPRRRGRCSDVSTA
jgi:glycine hydroxymethyltransferase